MDCIFCNIIKGELPAEIIHGTESVVALLDINPIKKGHTLVMPREHHEIYSDLPGKLVNDLMIETQRLAQGIVTCTESEGYNLLVNNHKCAGQAIPHVHVHIIPRRTSDRVSFNWTPRAYKDGEMEKVADQIRKAMKK